MSEANVKWIEGALKKVFNGEPFDKISPREFAFAMRKVQAEENKDPSTWNFGGYVIRCTLVTDDHVLNLSRCIALTAVRTISSRMRTWPTY